MRPGLLAVLLALPAPLRAAAPSPDACRYLEDVHGLPRSDCLSGARLPPAAVLAEAERNAPARRAQVEALIWGGQAPLLEPPLNPRTLPAWSEAERNGAAGRGASAELRTPQALSAQLSRLEELRSAEAAARALEGSLARPGLQDPATAPRPAQAPGSAAPPAALERPRRVPSDVAAPAPPPPLGAPLAPLVDESGQVRESLLRSIDRAASPCEDFFQYACGGWMREHPLDGNSSNDRFNELGWRNRARVRVLLEGYAARSPRAQEPDQNQLGGFYAACLDQEAIGRAGTRPLRPALARIRAVSDARGLADALAALHREGFHALFDFGGRQDDLDAREVIASIGANGSAMPREYFLDEDRAESRAAFAAHVAAMLELLGERPAAAARAGAAVLRIETELQRAQLPAERLRQAGADYHRMPVSSLESLAPSFPWRLYFERAGAPRFEEINVAEPEHLRALERLLRSTRLEDWRSYLAWRVASGAAGQLPEAFAREKERFGNTIRGGSGESSRRDQCLLQMEGSLLGGALGVAYAEEHFGPEARAAMLELAAALRAALADAIRGAEWMSPETRERALVKAAAVRLKVGYPDEPDPLEGLHVERGDAYGNARREAALGWRQRMARIGRPRREDEWYMPAHAVNAYYVPQNNEIVFPAGILQPPFFDPSGAPAVNFGAIGMIVGHELLHGFDDEGRHYDAEGNRRDWWTPADSREYARRAEGFVRQYSAEPIHPGASRRINGRLTLGENIADNEGLRLAYAAFRASPGAAERGEDGFTAEQSFFLAFGRAFCGQTTPENAEARAESAPHSPKRARVNGAVANMPEFRRAFRCRESGAPRSRIW